MSEEKYDRQPKSLQGDCAFFLTTIQSLGCVLMSGKVGVNCASRGFIDEVT